jgi:LysM repeat protein
VWRAVVALVATFFVASSGTSPGAAPVTHLTIEARTGSASSELVPSSATLTCDGSGAHGTGFLANAAKPACALAQGGTALKVASRRRQPRLCPAALPGPQTAQIDGTIGARRIDLALNLADGCGLADWQALGALLGTPERGATIPRRSRATPTTTAPPQTYAVRQGDTLTDIAKQFHTSVGAMEATNHLADPDHLTLGQVLTIPPPGTVRIEATLDDPSSGPVVHLALVGANPSELVTFAITFADGSTFTGSPHVASPAGAVATTYTGSLGVGAFTVSASGSGGTTAAAAFQVDAPD